MFQNINKHTILITVAASVMLFLLSSLLIYIFRDKTEEMRLERLNTAKTQMEQAQKQIDDAIIRKEKAGSCYKANSQTGVLANCELSFIPKAHAEEPISPPPEKLNLMSGRNERDTILMDRVCNKARNSPLCGDWGLYAKLKAITLSELPEGWWDIMLGISYAESHVGQNYTKDNAGGTCAGRNNWGGVKARVEKGGKVVKNQALPDEYNCWLYKFTSIEDYWQTKTNIFAFNYKGCVNTAEPIKCIAYNYVWNPNVAEPSWIGNVWTIAQP